MRDKRSYEIKEILKKKYPNAKFKVRIDKYSMGESIKIKTDIIKHLVYSDAVWRADRGNSTDENDIKECITYKKEWEQNKEKVREIEKLLFEYKKVDYDMFGEILSGGNTYLFIGEL